jgi:hypothetical protein
MPEVPDVPNVATEIRLQQRASRYVNRVRMATTRMLLPTTCVFNVARERTATQLKDSAHVHLARKVCTLGPLDRARAFHVRQDMSLMQPPVHATLVLLALNPIPPPTTALVCPAHPDTALPKALHRAPPANRASTPTLAPVTNVPHAQLDITPLLR